MNRCVLIMALSLCLFVLPLAPGGEGGESPPGNPPATRGLTEHDIIRINGDYDFTPDNGVSGGDGSPENPYVIEGYYIDGSPLVPNPNGGGYIELQYNYCIYIGNTTAHFVVRNCHLEGARWPYEPVDFGGGVTLFNVTNGLVENITTYDNKYGVYMRECRKITVWHVNSEEDSTGVALLEGCQNNTIHNITVSGNTIGVTLQGGRTVHNTLRDIVITETSGSGFSTSGVENNLFERITVSKSSAEGLYVSGTNNLFRDVVSEGNQYGIRIYSDGDTLRGVNASDNGNSGIVLAWGCHNNTLYDVVALNNTRHGIELDSCYDNTVIGAHCAFNSMSGIFFTGATHNTLTGILTERNRHYGVGLTSSSEGNMITSCRSVGNLEGIYISSSRNTITYSTFAENLKYGADLSGGLNCSGNVFHHNNFLFNNFSAQAKDDGSRNSWNDTEGEGNYWSDYQERYPNATNDGHVWDTPYETDGGSGGADHYPLVDMVGETPGDSHPPVALPGENMTVAAGSSVTLDGSGSYDPDPGGEIVNYTWTVNYQGEETVIYGAVVVYTFAEPGEYLVTLTVTDAAGKRGSHTITVVATASALFNVTAGPLLYDDGSPVVGAEIRVAGPAYTAQTTTGTDGNFTLENIPPGNYSVTITVDGKEYSTWLTVSDEGEVACNLPVIPGPSGFLSITFGPVKDEDGSPLPGVTVIVEWGGEELTAVTGDDGTATLNLPEDAAGDNLTVRLKKKGYREEEFTVMVDEEGNVLGEFPLMESTGAAERENWLKSFGPWVALAALAVIVAVVAVLLSKRKGMGEVEE